ncbi:SprB repeat-containing protein [Spirosomataceae bacterium TFI 002]|nr:SprB repeat-containing protein [Spirosomataceae bacterium TFI 002]
MRNLFTLLLIVVSTGVTWCQIPSFSIPLEITELYVCKGGNITLTAGTTDADTYQLQNFDNGNWQDLTAFTGTSNGNISIQFSNYTYQQQFRLKITNSTSGEIAYSGQVTLTPQEPVFDFQPINLVGCLGDDAFFKTSAVGVGTLAYNWEINTGSGFGAITASSHYKNVDSKSLTIDNLKVGDDNDTFRCVVTDENGCENISNFGSLSVSRHSDPNPTTGSTEFCEGEEAKFFVNNPIGNVLGYQWGMKLSSASTYSDLSESELYIGVQSDQLTLSQIKLDERNYRLVVDFEEISMDDAGNAISGTCDVSKTRTNYTVNPKPAFVGVPKALNEVCGEGTVSFEIEGGSGSYEWFADSTASLIGDETTFESATINSETKYFVRQLDVNYCHSYFEEVDANVNPLPKVENISIAQICPSSNQFVINFDVMEGMPDQFSLSSGTNALVDFSPIQDQSFSSNSVLVNVPNNSVAGNYDFNLSFKNSNTECESINYPFVLIIKKATKVLTQPISRKACENEGVTFQVLAEGEGSLSYQWYFGNSEISGEIGSSLNLENTNSSHEGEYYCKVIAECGEVLTDKVEFTLKTETSISSQPTEVELCAGNTATFQITAHGESPISYQWFQNGNPIGQNSSTLEIENVPFTANGSDIYCEVTSECGKVTSDIVKLKVEDAPSFPVTNNAIYCLGETPSQLSAELGDISNSLIWYDENLTVLSQAPTPSTDISGNQIFYVSEKSPGACEGGKSQINVVVNPSIFANLTASSDFICQTGNLNQTSTLNVVATGGSGIYGYTWKKVGTSIATSNTAELEVSQMGEYYVLITSATCSDSLGIEISNPVGSLLSPKISLDGLNFPNSISACLGTNLPFQRISSDSNINTIWYDADGVLGNSTTYTVNDLDKSFQLFVKTTKTISGFTCESDPGDIDLVLKESPSVTITVTNATCVGEPNGRIDITSIGSLQPYRLSLDGVDFSEDSFFENLEEGAYQLTVRNAQFCEKVYPFNIGSGTFANINSQPTDQYNCDGNIVNFEAEVSNYSSLQWQQKLPGDNWVDIAGENDLKLRLTNVGNNSNPDQAEYRLVANNAGCEIITNAAKLYVSGFTENLDNQKVCLGNDLTFSPPSFTGSALNFEWQERLMTGAAWNVIQDGLSPNLLLSAHQINNDKNAYRVKITFDKNGSGTCAETSDLGSIDVVQLSLAETIELPNCFGESSGSVSLSAFGGESPYLFSKGLNAFQSSNSFSDLNSGTYDFYAKDELGCEVKKSIFVDSPAALSIDSKIVTDVSCNGVSDGKIEILASGGSGDLTYTWSDGGNGTNLSGGDYFLTISDENSCSITTSASVTEPSEIILTVLSQKESTCSASNGEVEIISSGGAGDFEYKLDNGSFQTSGLFENLGQGKYTLTAKDQKNCIQTFEVEIGILSDFEISEIKIVNESCVGNNDGSIEVLTTGSTDLSFEINAQGFGANNLFENLASGSYLLKVKSSKGCEIDSLLEIGSTLFPTFTNVLADQFNCDGNTVNFEAEISNYNGLRWQKKIINEDWVNISGENDVKLSLSNVGNSTNPDQTEYRLIADNFGCEITSNTAKLYVSGFTNNLDNQKVCLGNDLTFSPPMYTGSAINFEWQERLTSGADWNVIQDGTSPDLELTNRQLENDGNAYRVKITFDKNGSGTCLETSDLGSVDVVELSLSELVVLPNCFGESNGSVTLDVKGGVSPYTYSKGLNAFQNSNSFSDLSTGTYDFYAKDELGCEVKKSIFVDSPAAVSIDSKVVTEVSCNGVSDGKIEILASGGTGDLTYTWSDGGNGANLSGGDYFLTISDENFCSATTSVSVFEPAPILITKLSQNASTCTASNGEVEIFASGGTGDFEYKLDNVSFQNSGLFENLGQGKYTLTAKDQKNCIQTLEVEIGILSDFEISEIKIVNESCVGNNDGSIEVLTTGSTDLSFEINAQGFGVNNLFVGLTSGSYLLKVKSSQGCELDSLLEIEGIPFPEFIQQPISQTNCKGNTVTFETSVSLFDDLIWQQKGINDMWVDISTETTENLRLSNIGNTANPHNSTFRLRAKNESCVASSNEVKLQVNSVEGSFASEEICGGTSKDFNLSELNLTGNVDKYTWQFREGTSGTWSDILGENGTALNINPTIDAYYRCKIDFLKSDGNTCVEYGSSSSGTKVSLITIENTSLSGAGTICEGEQITLSGTGCNGTLNWSDGQVGSEVLVSPSESTTYTAMCTIGECEKTAVNELVVTVTPGIVAPQISATNLEVCFGQDSTIIAATNCDGELIWSNGAIGASIKVFPDGIEKYTAICKSLTCESPVSNEIEIKGTPIIDAGEISFSAVDACSGYNPSTIGNESSPSFGNSDLSYELQWLISTSCEVNGVWSEIEGASTLTYNPPVLSETTCLKRQIRTACGEFDSNIIKINIAADPSIAIEINKIEICSNEVFQMNANVIGGAGTCEISWQKNEKSNAPTSSFWEDLGLSGEAVSLDNVQNGDATTKPLYFRAIIDCGPSSCNKATSEPQSILVRPSFDFEFNMSDTTICAGNELNIEIINCGGIIGWSDGSVEASRTVIPVTNIIYTVTCTSDCGSSTKSLEVNVRPGINPPVSTTESYVVVPDVLLFSAVGENLRWYVENSFEEFSSVAPTFDMVGDHEVWVSQYDGSCESPKLRIAASVYEPLRVVSISNDQYDCAGNSVKFAVEAVGVGNIHYLWQRKQPNETDYSNLVEEESGVKNVNTPYLTVSNVGRNNNPNGTLYRCQLIDKLGTITTQSKKLIANVLVGSLPSLSSCVGKTFDYNLPNFFEVIGDVKSYQWQTRGGTGEEWEDIVDDSNIFGSATPRLQFASLTQSNAAQYRCSVDFITGGFGCTETTDLSTFSVGTFPNKPIVENENYCQFETAKTLKYRAESGLDERWYTSLNQPLETATSKAPKPNTDIAGIQSFWVTQFSKEGCESPKQEIKVFINPEPSPPINTTPLYVDEGELLTFTATGQNLKWHPSKTTKTFSGDNPKHLEVGDYKYYVSQTSEFSCTSERTLIEASVLAKLGFASQPQSLSECEGNTVTFKSKAKGRGDLTYQWFRKKPNETEFSAIVDAIDDDFRISDAGEGEDLDQSQYRVEVKDSTGKIESEIVTLTVNTLTGKLKDVTLCETEEFELDFEQLQISGNVKTYLFQKKTNGGWETILESIEPKITLSSTAIDLDATYRLRIEFVSELTSICPRNTNEFDLKVEPVTAKVSFAKELSLCENSDLKSLEGSKDLIFYNQARVEISNVNDLNNDYLYFKRNATNSCTNNIDSVFISKVNNPTIRLPVKQFYSCIGNDFDLSEIDRLGNVTWYNKTKKLLEKPEFNIAEIGVENYSISITNEVGCESKRLDLEFISELCIADKPVSCGNLNALDLQHDEWNYLKDQNGQLIMAIHPQGQIINDFKYSFQIASAAAGIKSENGTIYLPKYFYLIGSELSQKPVLVRFYFNSEEINEHLDIVPNVEQNLNLFSLVQYKGDYEDCDLLNNQNFSNGNALVQENPIEPIQQGSGSAYFEVELLSFGEFGITANRFYTSGKLEAKEVGGKVSLKVSGGDGVRTSTFRIEKKVENGEWIKIGEGAELVDEFLVNGQSTYRAIHVDKDGVEKIIAFKDLFINNREPKCFTFPNPTESLDGLSVFIANIEPTEISITDIRGQKLPIDLVPQNEYFSRLKLPFEVLEGQYVLRIVGSNDQECTWKIIKQP